MGSVADREALYRFLANPKVTLPGVLNGHVRQTQERLQGRGLVRIVHDTSAFRFLGDREGLGVLRGGARGFLAHVALAVAADETREPLGVLGVHPYIHEDATAVVDHYRARWLIEEYFKALKTGCAFERRQLTHLAGLVRALAVFVPMAWRLLLLRHLGRASAPVPVSHLFDGEQVLLLRKLLKRRGYQLPRRPTMREAMLGIAALGGHIKNNGAPGWLVLGRGLTRFFETEVGWRLAREEM